MLAGHMVHCFLATRAFLCLKCCWLTCWAEAGVCWVCKCTLRETAGITWHLTPANSRQPLQYLLSPVDLKGDRAPQSLVCTPPLSPVHYLYFDSVLHITQSFKPSNVMEVSLCQKSELICDWPFHGPFELIGTVKETRIVTRGRTAMNVLMSWDSAVLKMIKMLCH